MSKIVFSLCLVALTMVALTSGARNKDQPDHFDAPGVIQGNKDNFTDLLEEHDFALVAFHAVWCGHCKRLAPNFVEAAGKLEGTAALISVEVENAGSLTKKYGVRGFPTLKVFREGEVSDYSGGRDTASIVSYMEKNAGPALNEFETAAEIADFNQEAEDVVVAGYFKSENSKGHKNLAKLAGRAREDFNFASTTDPKAVAEACGDAEECVQVRVPVVYTHEDFDADGVNTTSELGSVASLEAFVWKNSIPLVGHRTLDNDARFQREGKPLVTLYAAVDYKNNLKKVNYWANRMRKVADNYPSLTFALADSKEFAKELKDYGLDASADQNVVIRDPVTGKFIMEEEFSAESLAKFVEDFTKEELTAYIKSADVPKVYNSDYVTGVTGATFAELIDDNTEVNRLIVFSEEWCGHCKKLLPIYEELAEHFEDDDSTLIARVVPSSNDIGSFDGKIRGFPSIYWIPAGGEAVKYAGGRDLESFIEYINKNSK